MASGGTISLDIKQGSDRSTKHYNIDGIAYFRDVHSTFRLPAYLVILLPSIAGAILFSQIQNGILLLLGAVLSGIIWWRLRDPFEVEIGTLTNVDRFKTTDARSLEESFVSHVPDRISIQGDTDTRFKAYDYTYHFLPQNIVSVQRTRDTPNILVKALFILISVLVLLPILNLVLINLQSPIPVGPGTAGSLGLLVVAIGMLIGLYYYLFVNPEVLSINLQSGKTVRFVMDPSDIETIERKFTR